MFLIIVVAIAAVSIISSVMSLMQLERRTELEKKAHEELFKSKVIFKGRHHHSNHNEISNSTN